MCNNISISISDHGSKFNLGARFVQTIKFDKISKAKILQLYHTMGSCFSMPNRHEQQKATISQTTPLLHDWDSFVKEPPTQLDAELKELMYRLLNQLDSGSWRPNVNNPEQSHHPRDAAVRAYESQLRSGLSAILGYGPISQKQSWSDALEFARAVIQEPQDTIERSRASWARSCSVIYRELMTRFGQEVRSMAEQGCTQLVNDHYLGERLSVSHVDKKNRLSTDLSQVKAWSRISSSRQLSRNRSLSMWHFALLFGSFCLALSRRGIEIFSLMPLVDM